MKTTQYLFFTMKENPNHSEIDSHQLMLRAGLIRQLSSGIYIWLPTGMRILNNIKNIINQEMKNIGGIEIYMPSIQPANLWHMSKRWNTYGDELFKISDRKNHSFVLAPTHEEVVTNLIKNEIHSYKQLPILLYQIQNKFRDEIRPRSGVIRSREFIMKDAYSFHYDKSSLQIMYYKIYETYIKIFDKLQLKYRSVKADSNVIGGDVSHEFQAFSKNGEDTIICSNISNYAENIEFSKTIKENPIITTTVKKIDIIKKNKQYFTKKTINIFLVKANKNQSKYLFVALFIQNIHIIDFKKLEKISIISQPIQYASENEEKTFLNQQKETLEKNINKIFFITDSSIINNIKNIDTIKINKNLITINNQWKKYLYKSHKMDIKKTINEDKSTVKKEILEIKKSIEIGHIFQLDEKYSSIFKSSIQNKHGIKKFLSMGCYGIGITRIIAALIEQNYDNKGIIWPSIIAPFQVAILPIELNKSKLVENISEKLYQCFLNEKIDVLFNNKNERIGKMFSQMDLIGVPHQLIISEKNLKNNNIEYHQRNKNENMMIHIDNVINFIKQKIHL